jgi:hypothetical protein
MANRLSISEPRVWQARLGRLIVLAIMSPFLALAAEQICGRTLDKAALPVAHANATIYSRDSKVQLTTQSDEAGPRRLNATIGYTQALGERIECRIYARLENLANQSYFEDGFPTPGFVAKGGAQFSF